MTDPFALALRWRTDRPGRTIYAQYSAEPSGTDPIIGMMDSPELAEETVFAHNALLADRPLPNGQEVRGGG